MTLALQGLSREALTPRLRATLQRILTQSLARFQASIIARQSTWMAVLARETGALILILTYLDTDSQSVLTHTFVTCPVLIPIDCCDPPVKLTRCLVSRSTHSLKRVRGSDVHVNPCIGCAGDVSYLMIFLRHKDRPAEAGASDQALAAAALAPLSASTAAPRSGKLLHAGHQHLAQQSLRCADRHCMPMQVLEPWNKSHAAFPPAHHA